MNRAKNGWHPGPTLRHEDIMHTDQDLITTPIDSPRRRGPSVTTHNSPWPSLNPPESASRFAPAPHRSNSTHVPQSGPTPTPHPAQTACTSWWSTGSSPHRAVSTVGTPSPSTPAPERSTTPPGRRGDCGSPTSPVTSRTSRSGCRTTSPPSSSTYARTRRSPAHPARTARCGCTTAARSARDPTPRRPGTCGRRSRHSVARSNSSTSASGEAPCWTPSPRGRCGTSSPT